MKGKSIQNICIIFLFVLGATVTQAGAAVITVDNIGGGSFSSIQEAVNNAQNGDTILVSPGIYRENIAVDKELKILSNSTLSGDQTNRTYIIGAASESNVFDIHSNNVEIGGFYILGGSSGVTPQEVGINLEGVSNCSLNNNVLVLNDLGILLKGSKGNYLDGNLVSLSLGIEGISLVDSQDNILSNNIVVTNNHGISLNNSANNTLINNTADSNVIGVFLGMSQRNTLAYNLISRNAYGILGKVAESNTLTNNSLYQNSFGVNFTESTNNAIYGNEFVNFFNAMDDGNNFWNSSSEGNLWDKYTGNDTDGNGIGDTPYVINQTTGSIDYMPLVKEGNNSDGMGGNNSV
jgi:parallel beta-helix repeat protein